MIILRQKLMSESDKTKKSLLAGSGLIVADEIIDNTLGKKNLEWIDKNVKKTSKDKRGRKLYKKLREAFKRGGGIIEEGIDSSGNIISNDVSGIIEGNKKPIIQMRGGTVGDARTLSHELGHINYLSNPKADKLGRYSHKVSDNVNPSLGGIGVGFASGIRSAKKESEGEKEGVANRLAGGITAVGLNIPKLIAEGKASQHGYRLLKNAGASNKYLKSARKGYKRMLLSYGSGIATDVGLSELSRAAGRAYYNKFIKEENNDNSKK